MTDERKRHGPRGRTMSVRRTSKISLRVLRDEYAEETADLRPRTRGDCVGGPRPCPFVSCKYNLAIDVNPRSGAIKFNFPSVAEGMLDVDWDRMPCSCALDIADQGGTTLERVGEIMNLTRERVRQTEALAFERGRESLDSQGYTKQDFFGDEDEEG
jgi:hypothetical protein